MIFLEQQTSAKNIKSQLQNEINQVDSWRATTLKKLIT